jgi:ferredoxin
MTAPAPVDASILDAADEAGIFINNASRSGPSASCRVKLLTGKMRAWRRKMRSRGKIRRKATSWPARQNRGEVKVDA